MEKTTSIRFYWNGIKINGSKKLIKCYYSMDNDCTIDDPCVSISIRGYEHLPRDVFTVRNETDIYTDYFDNDRTALTAEHPLYKYARYAAECAKIRELEWYIRDMSERIATQPAFYARDDFYKNEVEDRRRRLAELQAHKNPGHPTAADLAAVEAMNLAAETARLAAEEQAEQERREKYLADLAEDNRIITDMLNSSKLDGLEKAAVTINWSENSALDRIKGAPMTVAAADAIFSKLNSKYTADENHGYFKTSFIIRYSDENGEELFYTGRFDIGSDSDTLIDHIKDYASWLESLNSVEQDENRVKNVNYLLDLMESEINPPAPVKEQYTGQNGCKITKIEVAPWLESYNRMQQKKLEQEVQNSILNPLKLAQEAVQDLNTEQLIAGIKKSPSLEVVLPFFLALLGKDFLKGLEMMEYIEGKFGMTEEE